MRLFILALPLLCGCPPDVASTGDTATQDDPEPPAPAPLATLSSDDCPDLTASGTTSFLSSDQERTVTVVLPEEPSQDMPVVFFFHGLLDTSVEPTSYHARALDLQAAADSEGAVFVLPQSRTMTMFGYSFYMWQVMDEDDLDLVLFDDLRTCIGQELDVDLYRVSAMGFSGGALFTTVLARERGDTMATMVEMSGGSDIDFSMISEDPIASYGPPAHTMPALLFSGGDQDVWPEGYAMVDFQDATDTLEANLVADGHHTWRCRHEQGHTVTWPQFELARDWALSHHFGSESPFASGAIDDHASWCTEYIPD